MTRRHHQPLPTRLHRRRVLWILIAFKTTWTRRRTKGFGGRFMGRVAGNRARHRVFWGPSLANWILWQTISKRLCLGPPLSLRVSALTIHLCLLCNSILPSRILVKVWRYLNTREALYWTSRVLLQFLSSDISTVHVFSDSISKPKRFCLASNIHGLKRGLEKDKNYNFAFGKKYSHTHIHICMYICLFLCHKRLFMYVPILLCIDNDFRYECQIFLITQKLVLWKIKHFLAFLALSLRLQKNLLHKNVVKFIFGFDLRSFYTEKCLLVKLCYETIWIIISFSRIYRPCRFIKIIVKCDLRIHKHANIFNKYY